MISPPSKSRLLKEYNHLPAAGALDRLQTELTTGHVVLTGPTGSGKTTLIAPALLDLPPVNNGRILLLEPRRVAARATARRISSMLDCSVGSLVGYRTRYESKTSTETRIEVVTEGILIRWLQKDPALDGVNLIIFDEFHERSIQADLGLALCLDLCELRDDLRLLLMSATLEFEEISSLLGNAPHISVSGTSYPVDIVHTPVNSRHDIAGNMAKIITQAWKENEGDILAFFPGVAEIHRCREYLSRTVSHARILPLFGNLSPQEQDRVFTMDEQRRIILATPIAETSLTIDNIRCVVDSGLYRRPIHDSGSGLSRLKTLRISKASATQRTGRAGRTAPGICYRLWSREEETGLLPRTPPEMISGDLSSLVLELALWGITDPGQLRWLDPPRTSAWEASRTLLQKLSLLDTTGKITELGQTAATLPLHPRLSVMLLAGKRINCLWTSCLLAALLSEKDLIRGADRGSDIENRLRLFARKTGGYEVVKNGIDQNQLERIRSQADRWRKYFDPNSEKHLAYNQVGNLLAFGFPDRIGGLRNDSHFRYLLSSGKGAELPEGDLLCGTPILVAPEVDARRGDGRIFLAASVFYEDLQNYHSQLLNSSDTVKWNQAEKRVETSTNIALGKLILDTKPTPNSDSEEVLEALLDGIRQNGTTCLPFTKESLELQARVCSLNSWFPKDWPDWSNTTLMADLTWLAPYCQGVRSLAQLKLLDLKTILLSQLDWSKQCELEKLAPTHVHVPSGSKIRLSYSPGEPPVLAVRLQEMFGLTETPAICQGKITVLLHLLSPARRPIQVTSDLSSFWQNSYLEVRKELAGRYPKHYWPEDPLKAVATSGTKRQLIS